LFDDAVHGIEDPPTTRGGLINHIGSFETRGCVFDIVENVEQLIEPSDDKDFFDLIVDVAQSELTPLLFDLVVDRDQLTQGGRGKVLDVLEIQQDLWLIGVVDQLGDLITDLLNGRLFKDISVQEADVHDVAMLADWLDC
jgi:hypothetical protein